MQSLTSNTIDCTLHFLDLMDSKYLPQEYVHLEVADFITKETRNPDPGFSDKRFDFKGHEFQEHIANDRSERVCVRKPSQVGLSELILRIILTLAFRYGLKIGYAMPTKTHLNTYVPTRIDPIIDASPKLSRGIDKNNNNKALKMFSSGGAVYMIHSKTTSESFATQLDGYFADEMDRLDPDFVSQLPYRLHHSLHKLQWKVCTPTLPEIGIDAEFPKTNQQFWKIKCHGCGEWQYMDFESIMFKKSVIMMPEFNIEMPERTNIDKEDLMNQYFEREPYIGCIECAKELDRYDYSLREWVKTYSKREYSGWDLNRFHVPRLNRSKKPCKPGEQGIGHDARTIIYDFFDAKNIKEFYNQCLGRAYSSGDESISLEDIKSRLATPEANFENFLSGCSGPCFMGIDQKKVINIAILKLVHKKLFLVYANEYKMIRNEKFGGIVRTMKYLRELMSNFRVSMASVDAAPDLHLPNALVNEFPSRSIYAHFSDPKSSFTLPTKNSRTTSVNRSWILDEVSSLFKGTNNQFNLILPSDFCRLKTGIAVTDHITSMVRGDIEKEGKGGEVKKVPWWKTKSSRRNDYMFAVANAVLALMCFIKDPNCNFNTGLGLADTVVAENKNLFSGRS